MLIERREELSAQEEPLEIDLGALARTAPVAPKKTSSSTSPLAEEAKAASTEQPP